MLFDTLGQKGRKFKIRSLQNKRITILINGLVYICLMCGNRDKCSLYFNIPCVQLFLFSVVGAHSPIWRFDISKWQLLQLCVSPIVFKDKYNWRCWCEITHNWQSGDVYRHFLHITNLIWIFLRSYTSVMIAILDSLRSLSYSTAAIIIAFT